MHKEMLMNEMRRNDAAGRTNAGIKKTNLDIV